MARLTLAFAALALMLLGMASQSSATEIADTGARRRAPEPVPVAEDVPAAGRRRGPDPAADPAAVPTRKCANELTDEQVAAMESDFQQKLAAKQHERDAAAADQA